MKPLNVLLATAAFALTINQAQAQNNNSLQNFKPPPPSQEKSFGQKLNDATTHTFSNGTTIQPSIGGRDKSVYDNPKDRGGTAGVKITY